MASTRRANQVADTIWKELAMTLKRSVSDPRLQTVTVTGVNVSSDLRHARIFVAMLDIDNRDEMIAALQKAAPFIRRVLSKETALRVVPALHFYFDDSIDKGVKLTSLINKLVDEESEENNDDSAEKDEKA
jgi:ribosome-binding factor A